VAAGQPVGLQPAAAPQPVAPPLQSIAPPAGAAPAQPVPGPPGAQSPTAGVPPLVPVR
jgi:hypothetical protein